MKENYHIENLIKLGLTEAESKVYLNLLKKKNFTATEISRLADIPRSKIYEILNKLINRGLCVEILGNVKKYSPANPETAFNGILQKLQQDYQQELENKRILISNLSETLLPLYLSEKENTDPLNFIQVLRDKNAMLEKVYSLERNTKNEVLSLIKAPYAININKPSTLVRDQYNCIKRGIKFKSIYEIDELKSPNFLEMVEMFASAGEEVRIAAEVPMKVMIFDEKIIMLAFKDKIISQQCLTAMIIEHPDLAGTLKKTFYMYWQEAMTLEEFKNKGV